jgi:hypothetical protein
VLSIGKAMAEAFDDIRADVLITKPSIRGAMVI